MRSIFLFHNSKWYAPIWALLFALSLILLWFNRKKWSKGYNTFFWISTLSIGIVYCPLFARILIPRFLPSFAEYERLAWVFFETPLFAYIFIMLSQEVREKRTQKMFITTVLLVLLFFGSPDNRSLYSKPQNKYKVSQDAVVICNKINHMSPQEPIVLCVQLESSVPYNSGNGIDGALYYGIRTYESRFRLRTTFIPQEVYAQDDFYFVNELPADIDYYICPKADNVYRELNKVGYEYVDEAENFAIFHNQNKPSDGEGS